MRSLEGDYSVIPGVTFIRRATSLPQKEAGSLKPAFATCSICQSCSQTLLYFCILPRMSVPCERILCTPPLPFGRKIPHLNYLPKTVKLAAKSWALRILAASWRYLTVGSNPAGAESSKPSRLCCDEATQIQFQTVVKLHGVFVSWRNK